MNARHPVIRPPSQVSYPPPDRRNIRVRALEDTERHMLEMLKQAARDYADATAGPLFPTTRIVERLDGANQAARLRLAAKSYVQAERMTEEARRT